MAIELNADQIEALQKIIVACREQKDGPFLFTETEVEKALERYPGSLTRNEVFPNQFTLDTLVRACVKQLDLEDQSRSLTKSFLFRLLEQRWDAQSLRHRIVEATPEIVRPPRGFAKEDIAALVDHLDIAIKSLPETPQRGDLGDVDVFRRLCENRETIVAMVRALNQLESLKAAHDSLQMLQVLGAASLNLSGPGNVGTIADLPPLITFAREGIKKEIERMDGRFPQGVPECLKSCSSTLEDAEKRLQSGDQDQVKFGLASLLALLIREMPATDAAMLDVWREFGLRDFLSILGSDSKAREASIRLSDLLRLRLMEHSLWQAIDQSFYKMEDGAGSTGSVDFLTVLGPIKGWVELELRVLLDEATSKRALLPFDDAVAQYLHFTDRIASARNEIDDRPPEALRTAFFELRDLARSAFLEVDQTLKQDLAQLIALKEPLQNVLDRVPPTCRWLLP
jgi:hypothetical protein